MRRPKAKAQKKPVRTSTIRFRGNRARIVATREAIGAMKYKAQ